MVQHPVRTRRHHHSTRILWVNPNIARGVLAYLAATQAREVLPDQDAEIGKICMRHARRDGGTQRIPYGRYYGSIDATPLFIMLAGSYYERTGDQAFITQSGRISSLRCSGLIVQEISMAMASWIQPPVERRARPSRVERLAGCVFHADGSSADGPFALCEVQGYVFAAKRRAGSISTGAWSYEAGQASSQGGG